MHARSHALVAVALGATIACGGSNNATGGPGNPGNAPPSVQAGFDRSVGKNVLVSLDGSASFDPEHYPLSYLWTFVSRPAESRAEVQNPISAVASFTPDVYGAYVLRLQVSDGVNVVADEVTITSVNQAPVARAGTDREGSRGLALTLSGSTSLDPDADPLSYEWSIVSAPAESVATLSGQATQTAGFTPDVFGAYVFRLTVSDGALSSTDEVTITVVNHAPVASAGADRESSRGSTLSLSGIANDADADPLTYQWAIVSAPGGSTTTLLNDTTLTPSFIPDAYGTYLLRLTVSDGSLSSVDEVAVSIVNHAPVANAGPDRESNAGATLALSGASSSDPDPDTLTCAWTLVARPETSAAELSDAVSCAPTVTFDVEGVYQLSLTVNDGQVTSAADPVQVTVHRHVWMLGHLVIDAEYSRPLDRIVSVGSGPDRLYVADPVTETEDSVALSLAPTSVSVSPDGLHAAVGHNGFVSYVRLSPTPLLVEKVIATTNDVFDLVLAGNGFVYTFPRVDQWVQIHCLEIATGAETLSGSSTIRAGTRAKLHPAGQAIYGADNGLSPSDIEKYGVAGGTAAFLYDSPYHGDYAMCGNLWISEDGLRIFTACGNTFHANTTQGTTAGSDMTYAGQLQDTTSVQWIDHSLTAGKVLAVPATSYWGSDTADTTLRVFGADYLALEETITLPRIGVGGTGHASHGRFAFFSQDATKRHAVVVVDSAAGLLTPHAVIGY